MSRAALPQALVGGVLENATGSFSEGNSLCVLVPNVFIVLTTWVGFLESLSPTLVLKSSPINLQSGWFRDVHYKYFSPVKLDYYYPHLTLSLTPNTVSHIEALGKLFLFFFPFPLLPFSSLDWRPSYLKHPGVKITRYLVMLLDLSSHNIHEPLQGPPHPCHLHSRPAIWGPVTDQATVSCKPLMH